MTGDQLGHAPGWQLEHEADASGHGEDPAVDTQGARAETASAGAERDAVQTGERLDKGGETVLDGGRSIAGLIRSRHLTNVSD